MTKLLMLAGILAFLAFTLGVFDAKMRGSWATFFCYLRHGHRWILRGDVPQATFADDPLVEYHCPKCKLTRWKRGYND